MITFRQRHGRIDAEAIEEFHPRAGDAAEVVLRGAAFTAAIILDEAVGIAEARFKIFSTEDEPMLEAVPQRMGDEEFWAIKPVILAVDAAPVLVRRYLQRMIETEQRQS